MFFQEVNMVLNISHEDKKKYKKQIAQGKISPRKSRTSTLSTKAKSEAFKKFAIATKDESMDKEILIDEHLKMNDSYQRTGWYVPKKK